MYERIIKPALDRFVAILAVIFLSPLIFLVAVALGVFQRGKVFFIQPRPGKNEAIFKLIKFKTMSDAQGPDGNLLPDEQRITAVGKFVRKTSLDELPQLFNVVKGDMSFVGPRPWLVEYLPLYSAEQRKRHDVMPGITGWAQVHGRNLLSWDERFQYDLYYTKNQSFWLDMKILLYTVLKVFKAEGVTSDNHATMEKFEGN